MLRADHVPTFIADLDRGAGVDRLTVLQTLKA
jgi:hypothetical protein